MGIALQRFYDQLWGTNTLYRSVWYGEKGTAPNNSVWFSTTADTLDHINMVIQKRENINLYHSCAVFKRRRRKQSCAELIKALWLDVDLKDTSFSTTEELFNNLSPIFELFSLKNPWVVDTGNGLHYYWMFDKAVTPNEWQLLAQQLFDFCVHNSIPQDTTRTRDCASMMRIPGSLNVKYETKEIYILREGKENQIQLLVAESPAPIYVKSLPTSTLHPFSTPFDSNSDFTTVANKCAVLREFSQTGFPDSEPLWYRSLGVSRLCIDGAIHSHTCSAKCSSYNESETTKKLEQLESKGISATTCETFKPFGLCNGCPFDGKITSPIQLGVSLAPIKDELEDLNSAKEKKRAKELIEFAPKKKWMVGQEGIFKEVEGIPVKICRYPFFIIDKFCEDVSDASVLTIMIRIFLPIGIVNFKLPLKNIAEDRKLLADFHARGVFPYDKKYFKEYIIVYLQNIEHIRPNYAVRSLGWQADNSFIYGSGGEGFEKTGRPMVRILDDKASGFSRGFSSKGSLSTWTSVISDYYSREGFTPHLFSLLCSMGAPFLPMTGLKGFIISLQGETGSGKTLAHSFAMSAWGDPLEAGSLGTKDTNTSILGRLGAIKNMPLFLDEATTLSDRTLSGLIYELANGRGRARCTVDGSLSGTSSEWQTITLITTNRPLLEHKISIISEAERNRILELDVPIPKDIMSVGNKIGKIMKENYGLAGKQLMQWAVQNRSKVQQIVDYYFSKFGPMVDDSKRFWVGCGVVAFTAATIAKYAGIFEFDLKSLYVWFVQLLQAQTQANHEFIRDNRGFDTKEDLIHALKDYLTGNILIINGDGAIITEPQREIKAKIIKNFDGVTTMYVKAPVFSEFIKMHYVNSIKNVRDSFGIAEAKNVRTHGIVGRYYDFIITDS